MEAGEKTPKKVVVPLDSYGAPLATLVTDRQPIISVPSVTVAALATEVTTLSPELPGVEAARAVRPLDSYGAQQGLVVGIKSSPRDQDATPTPEPEVPEGFQSSRNQWEPMTGVSRSMRMEDKEVEKVVAHTVRAQFEVEGDPAGTLTEWVITPNPGYGPAPVRGSSVKLAPPTQDAGSPWDTPNKIEITDRIETTTASDDIEPSFENLRDLMAESITTKTGLEDTLYTIFLEIMNETMAANLDTTTPVVPRRPESIEEIISFIKDVTNNTESFRSQATEELTDDDDLSKVTNIPFSATETPDDTPTILYPETTTTGKNLEEVNINRHHLILPIILPFATGCTPN